MLVIFVHNKAVPNDVSISVWYQHMNKAVIMIYIEY